MFSQEEREQIRAALVTAAERDPKITAAAHLGSAAVDRLDDWSDIDLALGISPGTELEEIVTAWMKRLYRDHRAVAHCDGRRSDTLYRVFLLQNTLQVDISFWPAGRLRAMGPKFHLSLGSPMSRNPRLRAALTNWSASRGFMHCTCALRSRGNDLCRLNTY